MSISSSIEMVKNARKVIKEYTVSEVESFIQNKEYIIIDIRDTDELKDTGVIPKSFNAPRGKLEFLADPAHQYYKKFFDTDKEIVLYCQTGSRSALAGQTLVNMGYSKVSHMIGGFKEWMISSGNIEDYK